MACGSASRAIAPARPSRVAAEGFNRRGAPIDRRPPRTATTFSPLAELRLQFVGGRLEELPRELLVVHCARHRYCAHKGSEGGDRLRSPRFARVGRDEFRQGERTDKRGSVAWPSSRLSRSTSSRARRQQTKLRRAGCILY